MVAAAALLACALVPSTAAAAADPLEGRWEFVVESGAPFPAGPVYDFVQTAPGTFTNKVVRAWGAGVCAGIDDQFTLTRAGSTSPGAQAAYRGTGKVYGAIQPCNPLRTVEIELVIRADGRALLNIKDNPGQVQHFRRLLVHVGQVSFDFRDRVERTVEGLRGQIATLGGRRDAVEARLVLARRSANAALKDLRRLDAEAARVANEVDSIRRSYRRLGNAAAQNPGLVASFVKRERELRPRAQQIAAQRQEALSAGASAAKTIESALTERQGLDRQLVQLGLRMRGLDAHVEEIRVTADGELVYRATVNSEVSDQMRRLKRTIAEWERLLASFDRERKAAKEEFLAAQRAVSAAELRLADQIWTSGLVRFFVDWASSAIDVGLASSKGGIIGAFAELQKQILEHAVFVKAVDRISPQPPAGTDPGSIEAELNRLYRGGIQESFARPVVKAGGERLVKETAIAFVTDSLAAEIAKGVYFPAKYEARFKAAGDTFVRSQTRVNFTAYTKAAKRFKRAHALLGAQGDRIRELRGGHELGFRSLAKTLGVQLLKDAAQAALKQRFADLPEQQAWVEFLEKDWYARSLWPRFAIASGFYWDTYDQFQKLLEAQASYLLALPTAGVEERVLKPFPRAGTLRIALRGQGNPGTLELVVGGVQAKPLGGFVYEVAAGETFVDPTGAMTIVIR